MSKLVKAGFWWRQLRRLMVQMFPSIRLETDTQVREIATSETKDVAVLPRFRDYTGSFTGVKESYLTQKYPQFTFVILYVHTGDSVMPAFAALDATRGLLRNPRVGMVMVGKSSVLRDCEKRVALLGLSDQIIIERRPDDIKQYLASADALVVTDTSTDADELCLYGAAAGVPMVMTTTNLRIDLFQAEEAALIVPLDHGDWLTDRLAKILNDNALRLQLRQRVRLVAEGRLYADPTQYKQAFRATIEDAIVQYDILHANEDV